MSRPSRTEAERLEMLEGISALQDAIQESVGILAVRLRQIQRRAPDVMEWIRLADEELARLADSCDDAQGLIAAMLSIEQQKRSR